MIADCTTMHDSEQFNIFRLRVNIEPKLYSEMEYKTVSKTWKVAQYVLIATKGIIFFANLRPLLKLCPVRNVSLSEKLSSYLIS